MKWPAKQQVGSLDVLKNRSFLDRDRKDHDREDL